MLTRSANGKIIIHIEQERGNTNSTMQCKGIAKKSEIALTTLLIHFTSLSIQKGKDPKVLIENHLSGILDMLNEIKSKDKKEEGGHGPPPFR